MPDTYKIKLSHITKEFKTRRQKILAVSDVNFEVNNGEFVSLVGPSGCGKSTIIRMIDGIISPSGGTITVGGESYTERPPENVLKKLGFIFQSSNLLPWMTVEENLTLPLRIFKMHTEEDKKRIGELLAMVGLTKYKDSYPVDLSGGMQQRLGVIRAMVHNPEILLMDEPFGALDENLREQLDLETLRIWKETGKTIIFITHNVAEAVLMSDRIIVMGTNPGRVVSEVPVDLQRRRTTDMIVSERFVHLEEKVVNLIGELDLSNIK